MNKNDQIGKGSKTIKCTGTRKVDLLKYHL